MVSTKLHVILKYRIKNANIHNGHFFLAYCKQLNITKIKLSNT